MVNKLLHFLSYLINPKAFSILLLRFLSDSHSNFSLYIFSHFSGCICLLFLLSPSTFTLYILALLFLSTFPIIVFSYFLIPLPHSTFFIYFLTPHPLTIFLPHINFLSQFLNYTFSLHFPTLYFASLSLSIFAFHFISLHSHYFLFPFSYSSFSNLVIPLSHSALLLLFLSHLSLNFLFLPSYYTFSFYSLLHSVHVIFCFRTFRRYFLILLSQINFTYSDI